MFKGFFVFFVFVSMQQTIFHNSIVRTYEYETNSLCNKRHTMLKNGIWPCCNITLLLQMNHRHSHSYSYHSHHHSVAMLFLCRFIHSIHLSPAFFYLPASVLNCQRKLAKNEKFVASLSLFFPKLAVTQTLKG